MVEIMYHLMGYVPAVQYTKAVPIHGRENEMFQSEHASLYKLFFGGDQLTVARARGALRTRGNSISPVFRLEGLIPCAEDWHTQLNLIGVSHLSLIINCNDFNSITGNLEVLLFQGFCRRTRNVVSIAKPNKTYECGV